MRRRTRRLKSLLVGIAGSFWSGHDDVPPSGNAPRRHQRPHAHPGVCPPLPRKGSCWGGAAEVGRGSPPVGMTMQPCGEVGKFEMHRGDVRGFVSGGRLQAESKPNASRVLAAESTASDEVSGNTRLGPQTGSDRRAGDDRAEARLLGFWWKSEARLVAISNLP